MNTQKPLKLDHRANGMLNVHEIFYTIQGEGPFAGTPAVFIRLSGCNLQCPACDTEYTGGSNLDPRLVFEEVVNLPLATNPNMAPPKLIVITGGEPLRQNIMPFVQVAIGAGYKVQVETNGTLPLCPPDSFYKHWPTVVCSPKTSKVNVNLIPHINAVKYVLENGHINERGLPTRALQGKDGVWQETGWLNDDCEIYVQPIDVQNEVANKQHLASTVSSALMHGHRLCLQMHKIANLP